MSNRWEVIRRRLRPAEAGSLPAAAVNALCGTLIAAFSSAHLVAVIARRITLRIPAWTPGEPDATIAGVPYDFRIYSLVLFGVVILAGAVAALQASPGVARGEQNARRRASNAFWMILAAVVPVMPIQEAAPILIVPALTGLVAVALGKFPGRFTGPRSPVRA
jgi:hypothetical protein